MTRLSRTLPVLPSMRCDIGCGECCGIVPASAAEYDRVVTYAREHGIKPVDQGTTCPWFQRSRCAVYEVRPTVCRPFGHVESMPCPRGYNVNVSDADARAWMSAQHDGRKPRLLHEVLGAPVGLR